MLATLAMQAGRAMLAKSRFALLALAAAPLAAKTPYLWRAYAFSPVDRANLRLYGALALVAVALAIGVVVRTATVSAKDATSAVPQRHVAAGIVVLAASVALYAIGIVRDINAIQLFAGVGILLAAAWCAFGARAAALFAPAALFAVLAIPGAMHWLHNAPAAFSLAAPTQKPFAPEFSADSRGGMVGCELAPSPEFTRFFRTSRARRFMYADRAGRVTVIAVEVGDDIHEIHPASHCLRSGGWRVESERLFKAGMTGDGFLEVNEIVANAFDGRMLVWVWYSNDYDSTGNFLNFRRLYSPDGHWRTYQVATAFDDTPDAPAAAQRRLRNFLGLEEVK